MNHSLYLSSSNSATVGGQIISVNQDTIDAPFLRICVVNRVWSEVIRFMSCAPLILKFSSNLSRHVEQPAVLSLRNSFFVEASSTSLYQENA
jgi:hypothetical protein